MTYKFAELTRSHVLVRDITRDTNPQGPPGAGFLTGNLYLTQAFIEHPKLLVVALNGPAIGLSAGIFAVFLSRGEAYGNTCFFALALIAHADIIYAVDSTFLLTPFSTIGTISI